MDQKYAWTVIHVLCTAFHVYFLHWKLGSPFWDNSGDYDRLTFWEQIDNGVQYTANRKFLTVVPVIVYLLASASTNWATHPLVMNTAVLVLELLGKAGFMHRVRLFGINKEQ
eukprot:TRINITY_DN67072_c3_g10_i1.p1 TRINITY_DN67072_c3_g10~~TRINITY_DN67072_c3_g10_i1.p1  ORF type:complete len:112 (-),score=57.70 TRINITY_DN67072_c3_g10_i1:60-395(-)